MSIPVLLRILQLSKSLAADISLGLPIFHFQCRRLATSEVLNDVAIFDLFDLGDEVEMPGLRRKGMGFDSTFISLCLQ
jgi:hypothetical protein